MSWLRWIDESIERANEITDRPSLFIALFFTYFPRHRRCGPTWMDWDHKKQAKHIQPIAKTEGEFRRQIEIGMPDNRKNLHTVLLAKTHRKKSTKRAKWAARIWEETNKLESYHPQSWPRSNRIKRERERNRDSNEISVSQAWIGTENNQVLEEKMKLMIKSANT